MAKTQGQVSDSWDETGRFVGRVETRKVKGAKEVDWPVTRVDTKRKKIARALWG